MTSLYPGPTSENIACLPQALTLLRQWVLWRGEDRAGPQGGPPKLNKIPMNPQTLTSADTTDPTTWHTFTFCVAALPTALEEWAHTDPAGYRGGGLGYVIAADDPYTGIDLDHCVDPDTGEIAPWAQVIIEALDSYTEITPSGTGLHVFVEGTLPPRGRRKGAIEMYDYARFLTMTGWHVPESPPRIESRQHALTALWSQVFGAGQTTPPPSFDRPTEGGMTDDVLIHRATHAHNGTKLSTLASGQWDHEYTSQSEADLALCCMLAFWTRDPDQLDRLFRTTGLMRPKWDEKRGAMTYGSRTVLEALARQTDWYGVSTLHVSGAARSMNGTTPPSGPWGTSFDFSQGVSAQQLMTMMRVPPRFLVEGLVPDGLTVLAAPAKSYKSYFSLSLALATIGEGSWCDTFAVTSPGNVVFFGLEAPLTQLRNRLYQLRPQYDPATNPHTLTFFSGMKSLPSFRQGLQQALEQIIDHYHPRLIVIDPLSYLYRLGRQDDLASATLDLLWPLAEMASAAQVSLFAPEHMRKRSKEDVSVVDQLAGSHIKAAVVHGLLMLHREGEDIIIETTMRDAASQQLSFHLGFDAQQKTMQWTFHGAASAQSATRQASIKKQVLDELKAKRYPMKVEEIIQACGLPANDSTRATARQLLRRAEQDGLLACSKRGEYYWIGQ